jgi:hypothetical protein
LLLLSIRAWKRRNYLPPRLQGTKAENPINFEPIQKKVRLETSDVSGYRLGCLRPIETEIRHKKA